ncbi:MAG: S-adenosylmethionine:tRNA ribosyltransferase-isomerase, partial [Lysobacterales bacterium]
YKQIKAAKEEGRSIVGVGTTSCRVLESIAQTGQLKGETNIFIYPGFSFKMVDILITNFHLPMSTLLMLVSAFASKDLIKRAYQEAIEKKYRFYSYGDAMIVL